MNKNIILSKLINVKLFLVIAMMISQAINLNHFLPRRALPSCEKQLAFS